MEELNFTAKFRFMSDGKPAFLNPAFESLKSIKKVVIYMKEHSYSIQEQKTVMGHFLKERRGAAVKEKLTAEARVTKNVKVNILKLSKQTVSQMEI